MTKVKPIFYELFSQWIDLIFGYRQQGEHAIEASNVYHHLFYEGNVDIFSIDDPMQRNATIGFINNFGQIPKQLFKKAHPAKKLPGSEQESCSSELYVNEAQIRVV